MTGDPLTGQTIGAAAAIALVAFVCAWAGVGAIRRFAERRELLDIPNERSSHSRPIPRGGGLAIVLVTLLLAAISNAYTHGWSRNTLLAALAGWAMVAAVSAADDLRSLPNSVRFAVHAAAAVLIVLFVGRWSVVALPLIGRLTLGFGGALVAFFWLVGLTNAYNFMDGIDGIAGSQAVVAGLAWTVLGWATGADQIAVAGLLIAAASTGFLFHNWPPARIFMGDVGSAFLGLVLATLAVAGAEVDPRLGVAGVLVVWPFVFDASFTFIRRALRHENVFEAHRSHLYQRLVILGRSHRSVTVLYSILAILGGALAVAWVLDLPLVAYLIVFLIPATAAGLWYYVRLQEHAR